MKESMPQFPVSDDRKKFAENQEKISQIEKTDLSDLEVEDFARLKGEKNLSKEENQKLYDRAWDEAHAEKARLEEKQFEEMKVNTEMSDAKKSEKIRENIGRIGFREKKEELARPLEFFTSAFSDQTDLRKNGGLYEDKGKLLADLPWDEKMMRGIIEKVRSVGIDMANALDLMWENGDTRSPIMQNEKDIRAIRLGIGKNGVPGSRSISLNFLRGGEYKTRMKDMIDDSYESKEKYDADKFLTGVKGSLVAGSTGFVMAGLAAFNAGGGMILPLAGVGFGVAGCVPMLGFGAWRLYKHFRNKRVREKQMKAIEKL